MKLSCLIRDDLFYLVSSSPRRSWLMSYLPVPFKVLKADNDCNELKEKKTICPHRLARVNSYLKAQRAEAIVHDGYIIGCDTVVFMGGKVYSKPADAGEIYHSLRSLSGNTHFVVSGITIIDAENKKHWTESEESLVRFREISDKEIRSYIESGEPFGKAGSYALQGYAVNFLAQLKGTRSNVYGLPLKTLISMIIKIKSEKIC